MNAFRVPDVAIGHDEIISDSPLLYTLGSRLDIGRGCALALRGRKR